MGAKKQNKPMMLQPRAQEHLEMLLAEIGAVGHNAHNRRSDRLATTFRPCRRNTDKLPPELREFDDCRLCALSRRFAKGSARGLRRRAPLAIYKPIIDLPGSGRISFQCERVFDAASQGTAYALTAAERPSAARTAVLLHQAGDDATGAELTTQINLPDFWFTFYPDSPPVFESTFTADEWVAARVDVDGAMLWPAWMFIRPADERWEVHPGDGSAVPVVDGACERDLSPDGAWMMIDGIWTPLCQEPDGVLADFAGMVESGRTIRNPAWAVLKKHGLVPRGQGYRKWLESLRLRPGDAALLDDDDDDGIEDDLDGTEAGEAGVDGDAALLPPPGLEDQVEAVAGPAPAVVPVEGPAPTPDARESLRDALERYVDLGIEGDRRPNLEALMRDLRAACEALGVPVPEGRDNAHDFFLDLLSNPWEPVEIDGVAPIQVLKLTGYPDPATMVYRSGYIEADFFDLGKEAPFYQQVPARMIREILHPQPHRWRRSWPKTTR